MGRKALPIGIDNFEKLITRGYYFIDKTNFIKDLLDIKGSVNLITRPRRFGKTLNISMLQYFFEDMREKDGKKIDNSGLFCGMDIMQQGEQYLSYMGQYPVISLSLKAGKRPTFEGAYTQIVLQIAMEYERHEYVLQCLPKDKVLQYRKFMNRTAEMEDYCASLQFLANCLKEYYGKKAIILIDEYDVPLENAYFRGFYQEMADFIRSFFEAALKTDDSLEFAVITGCLRISKESIFTGLNNFKVISIVGNSFARYFGFEQPEVEELLSYYGLLGKLQEVKDWYDGYIFGKTSVYNPWSMINYIDGVINDKLDYPRPYWANTSSNSIVHELIERSDLSVREEVERLLDGGTVTKPIHEDITYDSVYQSQDNLWNFLYFTGYLKKVESSFHGIQHYMALAVPNLEVQYIYQNVILDWFHKSVKNFDFTQLYRYMLEGDEKGFETAVRKFLKISISYHDSCESFYHGFMLGILSALKDYRILSNRETGDGRADIVLKPLDEQDVSVIMEFKFTADIRQLENGCNAALQQIEDKKYMEILTVDGYCNILKYGICFYKKTCKIKSRWDKLETVL